MYEVVWPRARRAKEPGRLSKRLGGLEGKTVGFLWNGVYRGNEVFPLVEKALSKRFPRIRFVEYGAFGFTHGPDEKQVLAGLQTRLMETGCDAVVSGMGC